MSTKVKEQTLKEQLHNYIPEPSRELIDFVENALQAATDDGYSMGNDDGYAEGLSVGEEAGFERGRKEGYSEGFRDAENAA